MAVRFSIRKKTLIIYRELFHVVVQRNMRLFPERASRVPYPENTCNLEIPVIITGMTPGDQVPVKGIKYKANGLHLPLAYFLVQILIVDLNNGFTSYCIL